MLGICTDVGASYLNMKYFAYVTYIWHLKGIFVVDTYMAVTHYIDIVVDCVLVDLCNMLGLYAHLVG